MCLIAVRAAPLSATTKARLGSCESATQGERGERRRDTCCFFSRYARIAGRTAFAIVNNVYCIPAYVLWMMALCVTRPLYAPLYWRIEGLMYHWLLAMVSLWSWTAGYDSKYTHTYTPDTI